MTEEEVGQLEAILRQLANLDETTGDLVEAVERQRLTSEKISESLATMLSRPPRRRFRARRRT